jgi:hypothetical protein
MIIPMYTTTTPQAPSVHTMRSRAYVIGSKVNSLLSDLPFPHVRHGCYLKNGPCAYSGTSEETKESPRTKAKCARERRKEKEEEPAATAAGHPVQPGHPA